MNVARPISTEEYKAFHGELYSGDLSRYRVELDEDPSMQPKRLAAKLSEVQAHKDRVLVILNRGILNEMYWKTAVKRIETKFKSECSRGLADPDVLKLKSKELREAKSEGLAEVKVVQALFKNEGTYEQHITLFHKNFADAQAFLAEIRNIYENLDSTDTNLARQLRTVMIDVRLRPNPEESGEERTTALTVGA